MHIFSVIGWTTDQWIMFACFTAAGLGGLGLIGVTIRDVRARRTEYAEAEQLIAGWRATPSLTIALLAGEPARELAAHLAPGAGSLSTLALVGEGSLMTITHADLVEPEIARQFADLFDRPAHAPGRTEAGTVDEGGLLTRFNVALEPAMRKARLWALQGAGLEHGGSASHWAALDQWRIDCPTGEYALVDRPELVTA